MDAALWNNILNFDFDRSVSEYGFSTRLENENFWTTNFAKEAIIEYKKFMYLATVTDSMVSPSEIVDTVWHQHLIFTDSYDTFCILLGKKIAHVPSTHNRADFDKFKEAKERTRKIYTEIFGEQPAEFWEHSNMLDALEMKKSVFSPLSVCTIGMMVSISLGLLAYYSLLPLYARISSVYFLVIYPVLALVCFVFLEAYNRSKLNKFFTSWSKNSFVFKLSALELVYLRRSRLKDVIDGVVNQLVLDDKISIVSEDKLTVKNRNGITEAMDFCVIDTIGHWDRITYRRLLNLLLRKPVFNKTVRSMENFKDNFNRSESFVKLFAINFSILSFAFILGAVRVGTGISRGKPISIIVIMVAIHLILIAIYLYRLRSSIGSMILPGYYKNIASDNPSFSNWEWGYFLAGSAVFAGSFEVMASAETKRTNDAGGGDSGSSSCGSSCGSSCDSSCGGCGD